MSSPSAFAVHTKGEKSNGIKGRRTNKKKKSTAKMEAENIKQEMLFIGKMVGDPKPKKGKKRKEKLMEASKEVGSASEDQVDESYTDEVDAFANSLRKTGGEGDKNGKRRAEAENGVVEGVAKRAKKEKSVGKEIGSVELGKKYLEWIISPVPTEQFFADSWEQRPLHIHRRDAKYYKDLFSTKELDRILRDQHVLYGKNLDVTSYTEEDGRQTHNPGGRAFASTVWDYYYQDCSVRMLNPQTFSETVWKGCATLQEFFQSMVGANVYLTPPGTQGFAPHYDDVEVFMLQLEGKKRWRLYEPRSAQEKLPRFSSGNFAQDEIGEPCMDVVLEAGDLIYMPRGTIHQGTCFPDQHSLHITISCHQLNSFGDLLEKVVPAALKTAIEEDVEFRRGLPIDYLSYMGVSNSDNETKKRKNMMALIEKLLKKLVDYAPVDAAVDQMGKRLMRDALPPYLTPSEEGRCVQGDGERWNAATNKVCNRVEIDPDTEIRLVRANAARLVTEDEVVRLYYSVDNTREYHEMEEQFLEIDAEAAPAVEALSAAYPEYVRADKLPLDYLNEQMKVVQDLWERKLIVTRKKLDSHYDD